MGDKRPVLVVEKGKLVERPVFRDASHHRRFRLSYVWVQGWHELGTQHDMPLSVWRDWAREFGHRLHLKKESR